MAKNIIEIEAIIEQIMPVYLKNLDDGLSTIDKAIEEGDLDTVKRISHMISGNSAGYGFVIIGDYAKSMEKSADAKNMDDVKSYLVKIKSFLDDYEIKYI